MTDVHLLHYDLLAEFKKQYYKDLLTLQHVKGSQIKIDKIWFPDGGVNEQANFWGYEFNKDGVKYLLSSKTRAEDGTEKEIILSDILPIFAKNLQKVAYRGQVYYQIKKPVSAKIRPVKHYSFREMVDLLSSIPHSNPTHQKLLWFLEIAQMIDRANVRISSPPGFGKDSTVAIMGDLIGNCATVENPTIAKLEYMHSYKHVAVNEVVGVQKAAWRDIEQYLLAVGAFKSSVTKRSRANEVTREEMNVSRLCLSLFYNDIDQYDTEFYFDDIAKGAVSDRFVPLRFHGRFTEKFQSLPTETIQQYVARSLDTYKKLISTLAYYGTGYISEMHGYDARLLRNLPQRWEQSIRTVLRFIDVYCDSQEEFDSWVTTINNAMEDYFVMLKYPQALRRFVIEHLGFDKEEVKDDSPRKIMLKLDILTTEKREAFKAALDYLSHVLTKETFIERVELLSRYHHEEKKYTTLGLDIFQ